MSLNYSTGLFSILRWTFSNKYQSDVSTTLPFFKLSSCPLALGQQANFNHPVAIRRLLKQRALGVRVFNWRSRFLDLQQSGSIGLTLRVTKNNVFIVVYTAEGKNMFWLTRGRQGHKFNLYTSINLSLIRLMFSTVLDILTTKRTLIGPMIHCLTIRGRVPTKRILQDLRKALCVVRTIRISQPLPHNGCRLPRRRRGARN